MTEIRDLTKSVIGAGPLNGSGVRLNKPKYFLCDGHCGAEDKMVNDLGVYNLVEG